VYDENDQHVKKSKSEVDRTGNRYFEVDKGYDRRFYENSSSNIIIIILVFLVYYVCQILYFWALLAFGSCFPDDAMWYSIAIFIFINLWIVGMLISGHLSNEKLKHWEYYLEKINDKEQELRDYEQREA
jgi:hypothetical protein